MAIQTPFIILKRGRVVGLERTEAAGKRLRARLGEGARLYHMTTGELAAWRAVHSSSPRTANAKNAAVQKPAAEPPAVRWYRQMEVGLLRLPRLSRLVRAYESLVTRAALRSRSSTEAGR